MQKKKKNLELDRGLCSETAIPEDDACHYATHFKEEGSQFTLYIPMVQRTIYHLLPTFGLFVMGLEMT